MPLMEQMDGGMTMIRCQGGQPDQGRGRESLLGLQDSGTAPVSDPGPRGMATAKKREGTDEDDAVTQPDIEVHRRAVIDDSISFHGA